MRRIRFLGHPVHPPLVHLPMGLLVLPFPLQAAAALTGRPELLTVAAWCEGIGLSAAVPAAVTGFLDYLSLQGGEGRTLDKAGAHMLAMSLAVCLLAGDFLTGWFARGAPLLIPLRLMLSGTGLLAIAFGGYLGGDLVWRHGVGREGGGAEPPREADRAA